MDLRWELLWRPLDRIIGLVAAHGRAVSALGPRVFVHPVMIVLYAMLVATALRTFRLATNPPGMSPDEAVSGYDAWSLLHTLRDHHGHTLPLTGFQSFGDWTSPFLTYWLVPFVAVFGLEISTIRLGTVVLGLIAIPATFLFVRELTGRASTGAAAACFLAISPWAVHLSRFGIPPATVVPLLAVSLWLTLRAFRLRTAPAVTLAGLATGLLIMGYPTMKLYVPMLLIVIVALYYRAILVLPVRALLSGLAVFLLVVGPSYLAFLIDPAMSNRQEYVSVMNRDDFTPWMLVDQYWHNISPNFLFERAFITQEIKGEAAHGEPGLAVELAWTTPFLVIGLVAVLFRMVDLRLPFAGRRPAFLVVAAILLSPIPAALTYPMNSSRNAQLALLVAILAGIGLVTIADLTRAAFARRRGSSGSWSTVVAPIALVGLLLVPLVVEARTQFRGYLVEWPLTERAQFFYGSGLEGALAFVEPLEDEYDEIWVVGTNQAYIYFLFYDQTDPLRVHQEIQFTTQNFAGFHVEGFGPSYRFSRPYWGPPDELDREGATVMYESYTPGAIRGYVIRELDPERNEGRRILVVQDQTR